ncbi:MAG: hypothetical protein PHH49_04620 [Candidatus Omnitrophica bacterium]|nr:hypothetical protein [Candidatus Omnitrophota bacterium]MDD5488231.1 hypothetical protein [Candidatus Omnitrophota bacterium]
MKRQLLWVVAVSFLLLFPAGNIFGEGTGEDMSSFSSRIEKKNLSLKMMEQDTKDLLFFCEIVSNLIPMEKTQNSSAAKYSARLEEKLGALVNESLDGSTSGLQHTITQPMIMDMLQPKSRFNSMETTDENMVKKED